MQQESHHHWLATQSCLICNAFPPQVRVLARRQSAAEGRWVREEGAVVEALVVGAGMCGSSSVKHKWGSISAALLMAKVWCGCADLNASTRWCSLEALSIYGTLFILILVNWRYPWRLHNSRWFACEIVSCDVFCDFSVAYYMPSYELIKTLFFSGFFDQLTPVRGFSRFNNGCSVWYSIYSVARQKPCCFVWVIFLR